MIDIIIPAYNAHSTIEKTLLSISCQTISDDLNVYIVNNKSEKDYKEIVNNYSRYLNIKEIDLKENVGPGLAREEGLKHSKSEYIMFIDSDDMFASPKSIELLYLHIKNNNLDLVIGNFVEVLPNDFVQHNQDQTWLHGKIFRRKFIEDHNIHFNNTRANEDNYFMQCIMLSNPKMEYYDYPIYFWEYNENSITRKNNLEYNYKGIFGYIENMDSALEYAINNKCDKTLIANFSYSVMLAIYYYYIQYEDIEFLKLTKNIKNIYIKHLNYINNKVDIERVQYELALDMLDAKKINSSILTFDEFLKKVGE